MAGLLFGNSKQAFEVWGLHQRNWQNGKLPASSGRLLSNNKPYLIFVKSLPMLLCFNN